MVRVCRTTKFSPSSSYRRMFFKNDILILPKFLRVCMQARFFYLKNSANCVKTVFTIKPAKLSNENTGRKPLQAVGFFKTEEGRRFSAKTFFKRV